MSRVNSGLSAVLFAFFVSRPPVKEGCSGKRLVQVCIVRTLLVSDIYLNVLPASQKLLNSKMRQGLSSKLGFDFLLLRRVRQHH